ncbi:NFX1-type zinc finger-containing protein 1 [Desmophyllum pertusum]|uniref:NFX1-type zinc finger-containing protein 1 n=1 Tax=Desmophyllum pertusum TaxID=174260 RepID=A0A9X0D319_9CNID|nr:NFX1-type zinc finger-containing protein 1 [Desmophyllum pertusum]
MSLGSKSGNAKYQMVESPAYYEAYRHVLKGLKELDETTLPFKKYLVECSEDVDPPEYLRREDTQEPVRYDLTLALDVPDAVNASAVPVLQPKAWPSVEALPLNSSQLEALKTAVTTEFSVIQGPPGTGKTYVGAKIVRCLLENRETWDPDGISPMLMVCYTNHALDQFLEKVLEFLPKEQIIRVGGRCKSQQLEGCNIKLFTGEYRLHQRRREVRDLIQNKVREMRLWKELLAKADTELLEFDDLEELLNSEHAEQLYNAMFPSNAENECRITSNTFKLWLCSNKQMNSVNRSTKAKPKDQAEKGQDGSILLDNEAGVDGEVLYHATLLTAPRDTDEGKGNNPPARANENLEEQDFLPTREELKEKSLDSTVPKGLSGQQSSELAASVVSQASLHVEHIAFSKKLKDVDGVEDIKRMEDPQIVKDNSDESVDEITEAFEETITIEKEADLIQYQRCIHGDEDFLPVMPKQSDDISSQKQDEEEMIKDQELEWKTVTYRKKRKTFPWQQTTDENSKDGMESVHVLNVPNEEDTAQTKSSKKNKRKKNKKKNKKVNITADIKSLKPDLEKETAMSPDEAMVVDNIWLLTPSERHRLYLFWVENYRERYRVEIHRGEQEYEQRCHELEAVRFEEEQEVIRRATVVGMTTSGAARYHSVLQRVAPKIVVIEEAAEVMEAHIITSLSHDTKHTILIGDHKQLRPKATVYELAQKYNLAISLFERMIMNSMDCKRLCIQHRMRPEIAALTKRIYDHEIVDHESVCEFDDIKGVTHNLFFIDHCQPEILVGGLQSYSNPHEADFLVALCNYLLLQGYGRSQITILTMYTGQLLLLQEKMPRRTFGGVKVCAVDNFQGEENDIILLSLVRSNSERRIGFLGESNRICVALSRARQGFYCIGNFSMLSQCKLWKEICDYLQTKNAIGQILTLVCKKHENVTNVRSSSDFDRSGGCKMPCGDRLDCGHACDRLCHVSDLVHKDGQCSKMCFNCCPNGHQCELRCHSPIKCPTCYKPVLKTIPGCGHEQRVQCSIDPANFSCQVNCEKIPSMWPPLPGFMWKRMYTTL